MSAVAVVLSPVLIAKTGSLNRFTNKGEARGPQLATGTPLGLRIKVVMRLILCLACLPALLFPQSIAVPHSGITFDGNSETFRPVLGVAGASRLGDPLELRGELHNVGICSQQQFAIAAAGRDGVVTLLRLDTLKASELLPALLTGPSRLELSAACSAAVVYSAPASRLQIVTGLPAKPVLAADLTVDLPGSLYSLAISDDGQLTVAAISGKAICLLPAAGRPVSLLPIAGDAVVAFRGNQDVIVADRSSNTVTLVESAAASPAFTVLARPENGIDDPSAVWFDSRTSDILVANSGNSEVNILTVPGGSMSIGCECQVNSLWPLTDRTYQLQAPAPDQPLTILDLESSPPRIVFVATPELPTFPKGRHTSGSDTSRN
jgi:hypothetical protein